MKYKNYQTLQEVLAVSGRCDALISKLTDKQEILKSQIEKIEKQKTEAMVRAKAKLTRLTSNLTLTVPQLVYAFANTFNVEEKDVKVFCETYNNLDFKPCDLSFFLGQNLFLSVRDDVNEICMTFPLLKNTLNGREFKYGFELLQFANLTWGLRLKHEYKSDLRIKAVDFQELNDMPIEFINNLIIYSISHENEKKNSPSVE